MSLLSSLSHGNFRLLLVNLTAQNMYFTMQNILVSYLILTTTKSVVLVGAANAINWSSYIFSMFSGVAADRYSKKHLLLISNIVQVVLAIAFGLLILAHDTPFSVIAILVLITGIVRAFVQPTRLAFLTEVVATNEIPNATSLSASSQSIGAIVGPALVGILTNVMSIGSLFFVNALLVGIGIIFLIGIHTVKSPSTRDGKRLGIASELRAGFGSSWGDKAILGGQLTYFVTNLFMFPAYWTIVPVFAVNTLHLNASGLGWLVTANGVGGLLATLILASKAPERRGLIVSIAAAVWGAAYLIIANFEHFYVAEVCLFGIGLMASFTTTLASIITLTKAPAGERGRVMGLQTVAISSQGPGSFLAGEFAQFAGPGGAFDIEVVLFLLVFGLVVGRMPAFRKA